MVCSKGIFSDPFYKPFKLSQLGSPNWCSNVPEVSWTRKILLGVQQQQSWLQQRCVFNLGAEHLLYCFRYFAPSFYLRHILRQILISVMRFTIIHKWKHKTSGYFLFYFCDFSPEFDNLLPSTPSGCDFPFCSRDSRCVSMGSLQFFGEVASIATFVLSHMFGYDVYSFSFNSRHFFLISDFNHFIFRSEYFSFQESIILVLLLIYSFTLWCLFRWDTRSCFNFLVSVETGFVSK